MKTQPDTISRSTGGGKPDKVRLSINGATISGVKLGGKWRFTCKRWPELSKMFNGAESAKDAMDEFTRRALIVQAVTPPAKGRVKR